MATVNYQKYYNEMVRTLVRLVEEKDVFLKGHSERVATGCMRLMKAIGLQRSIIERTYLAGLLHDIGMVYLPLELVQKPGDLTGDEMEKVKEHPEIAEKILTNLPVMKGVLPIIRHHHEAFDGSGYPDGLKGEQIPSSAGYLAIMDSYCAMTSERPHRPAMNMDEAIAEIEKEAGTKFDPELVKQFVAHVKTAMAGVSAPTTLAEKIGAGEGDGLSAIIAGIIERFKKGKVDLPVLPNVVHEIQKVIKSPITTTDDVAGIIEKDAVISLRLISTANSPMYRGAKKIMNVAQAVPRLGMKQTQSIVSAIANKDLYKTQQEEYNDLMQQMWQHSLACAYAARDIAKGLQFGDIDQYFLLGLIHDIGKVMLLKALVDTGKKGEAAEATKDIDAVIKAMQDAHCTFGGVLLQKWNFDKMFASVAIQHDASSFTDNTIKEVLVIHCANMLTRKIGYSLFNDEELDLEELESRKLLKMSVDDLEAIGAGVRKVVVSAAKAF